MSGKVMYSRRESVNRKADAWADLVDIAVPIECQGPLTDADCKRILGTFEARKGRRRPGVMFPEGCEGGCGTYYHFTGIYQITPDSAVLMINAYYGIGD